MKPLAWTRERGSQVTSIMVADTRSMTMLLGATVGTVDEGY